MVLNRKCWTSVLLLIMITSFSIPLSACSAFGDFKNSSGQSNSQTSSSVSKPLESETPAPATSTSTTVDNSENDSKILIVYFSRIGISESFEGVDVVSSASLPNGNTITIANMIADATGGDLTQIITEQVYPANYDDTIALAADEQDSDFRPDLKGSVENWDSYDTIFLGYPNWWGTLPMAVFTFLEEYDFSGKTIIPFCTHDGSRLGSSERDIAKTAPEATLLSGLAIRGSSADGSRGEVEDWLEDLGLLP